MTTASLTRAWAAAAANQQAACPPCRALVQPAAPLRMAAFRRECTSRGAAHRQSTRRVPRCTTAAAAAADVGFVREYKHTLPDGMKLEVLHLPAAASAVAPASPRPPLLFIHGSYHGAWCWRERWMPWFAAAGYDCYAISLRGQGGSDRRTRAGEPLKVSGDLQSLADDLGHVIASLPAPPVVVAHSFGTLLVEQYLTQLGQAGRPALAGVASVCGVPPSGNKNIIARSLKKSLGEAWRITWAFVAKSFARSLDECRFAFFSDDLPKGDLIRYQQQLAACSPVRLIDLAALNKVLPLPPLPAAAGALPAFVAGSPADLIVDWPAVEESAAWFGVQPVRWERTAHDCMLDTRWEAAADSLRQWLDGL